MNDALTIDCPICHTPAGVPCSAQTGGVHFAREMKAGYVPTDDEE